MPEKAKLIGSLYEAGQKQYPFKIKQPNQGTYFIMPTPKEVAKYGYTECSHQPDWIVSRSEDEVEEKLGASPQALARTEIQHLRLHGIPVDINNPITFLDMGSGNGRTIRELSENFHHRETDILNGENIANLIIALGITRKIHFNLHGLLHQQVQIKKKSNKELYSFLSTLATLIKQRMWKAKKEQILNEEMQGFLDSVNNLPLLLNDIKKLNLFEDFSNPYLVKISKRSIEDEFWSIPEKEHSFVDQVRRNPIEFFKENFTSNYFQSIKNKEEFHHTENLPIHPENTFVGGFHETDKMLPKDLFLNTIMSSRGTSHSSNDEYYFKILEMYLRKLTHGGLCLEDGITEDTTGKFRVEPIRTLNEKLKNTEQGEKIRVHIMQKPEGNTLVPSSILIEKGIKTANGNQFLSSEGLIGISKNRIATSLKDFFSC